MPEPEPGALEPSEETRKRLDELRAVSDKVEAGDLEARRETPHKYIGVNTGVADTSNDPEGATIERGRALLEAIVERVAARALLTETTSGEDR